MNVSLRAAEPRDVTTIVALIAELAAFEHLTHQLEATPERLTEHLFGATRFAEATVAVDESDAVVGYALCFLSYSTFLAKPGLYLEDLYVRPSHRGRGIGMSLLAYLAKIAVERGHGRFEWSVLDWNRNAIDVYERAGATVMPEWRICRVTGEALGKLAARAP